MKKTIIVLAFTLLSSTYFCHAEDPVYSDDIVHTIRDTFKEGNSSAVDQAVEKLASYCSNHYRLSIFFQYPVFSKLLRDLRLMAALSTEQGKYYRSILFRLYELSDAKEMIRLLNVRLP